MLQILDWNIEDAKEQRAFLKAELDYGDDFRDLADEAQKFVDETEKVILQAEDIKDRLSKFLKDCKHADSDDLKKVISELENDMGV